MTILASIVLSVCLFGMSRSKSQECVGTFCLHKEPEFHLSSHLTSRAALLHVLTIFNCMRRELAIKLARKYPAVFLIFDPLVVRWRVARESPRPHHKVL